jgi:hypothetical protein
MVNVTGPLGILYSSTQTSSGQLSVAAYLDFGTYTQWVGGCAGASQVGQNLVESAFCGASVPVNSTVGMVMKLVMTHVSGAIGLGGGNAVTAQVVFGVEGGIQGGGNAASGISIVPI